MPISSGHGFTLVELLIVLVLVGVLSALLIPMLLPSAARTLQATVAEIHLGLRETRRQARALQQAQYFFVDTSSKRYRIGKDAAWQGLPESASIELTTAQSLLDDTTQGAIAFHPNGSSSGGRIVIGLGEHIRQIDVEWLTGRTRVAETAE